MRRAWIGLGIALLAVSVGCARDPNAPDPTARPVPRGQRDLERADACRELARCCDRLRSADRLSCFGTAQRGLNSVCAGALDSFSSGPNRCR